MRTRIPPLCGAALFACSILAAGCQDGSAGEGAPRDTGARSRPGTLAGEWRWVASEREGQVIRPTGSADSTTFELGPLGRYREYTRGARLESHYSLAEGRTYQLQDTTFTVLVFDSSRFFPRSGEMPPAAAVRSIRGDTLFLSGTGTDATLHTFVRAGHAP